MYTSFPGLNSYLAEKKVVDVENSIISSLINEAETPRQNFKLIYICGFIIIGCIAALITYICIKFL